MTHHKRLPVLAFASRAHWEAWLDEYAARSPGVWLKFAKKASGVASVGKAEAIEMALAHGWIDGQLDKYDEHFWLVRFTPRGPGSKWSRINRDIAVRLIAEGRMKPNGSAEIEKAKSNGRWEAAYAPQSKAEIPQDLRAALDAHPQAKAFFATLKGANRYAILYRVHDARTPKTRAARIEKFVGMLALGQTIHPTSRVRPSSAASED
jgi:uncharacterized protein YdeI (YjbR/CyaY-like superfamily)